MRQTRHAATPVPSIPTSKRQNERRRRDALLATAGRALPVTAKRGRTESSRPPSRRARCPPPSTPARLKPARGTSATSSSSMSCAKTRSPAVRPPPSPVGYAGSGSRSRLTLDGSEFTAAPNLLQAPRRPEDAVRPLQSRHGTIIPGHRTLSRQIH